MPDASTFEGTLPINADHVAQQFDSHEKQQSKIELQEL